MSDYDRQFQADLERAQALSIESLALEQFRRQRRESSGNTVMDSSTVKIIGRSIDSNITPPAIPPPPRRGSRSLQRTSLTDTTPMAVHSDVKSTSSSPIRQENNDLISFTSPTSKKEDTTLESFKEYIDKIQKLGQQTEMSRPARNSAPATPQIPGTPHCQYSTYPFVQPGIYNPPPYQYGSAVTPPYPSMHVQYPMPIPVYPYNNRSSLNRPSPVDTGPHSSPFTAMLPYNQTRMSSQPVYQGYPPPRTPQTQYNYSTTNMISRPSRPQQNMSPSIYPQLSQLSLNAQPIQSSNGVQTKQPPITTSGSESSCLTPEVNSLRPEFSRTISEASVTSNEMNDAVGALPNLIDFGKNIANSQGSVRVSVLEAFDPLLIDQSNEYMVASEYSNSSVYEEYDPLEFLYSETEMREMPMYATVNKRESVLSNMPSPSPKSLPSMAAAAKPATMNKLYDCITKMRTRNYDIEHRTFLDMLLEVRGEFEHSDATTNPGYVIASKSAGKYPPSTSIKLIVYSSHSDEPITFTCDIESTVEHVIMHVVCTLEGEIKEDISQYVLRVWGEDSYLLDGSALSEYNYIRQCIRLEKDVKLCLCDEKDTSLARSELDDIMANNLTMEDLFPTNGSILNLSFDNLSILLETLEGELSRAIGEMRAQGVCSPNGVVQTVKAICALAGNLETLHITTTLQMFIDTCSSQSGQNVVKPEIVSDGSGEYVQVNVRTANAAERVGRAAQKIREAVRSLIHTYTRTALVDFQLTDALLSAPADPDKAIKSYKVKESTLFCTEAVHRIPVNWSYHEYILTAIVYYGTRPLHKPLVTRSAKVNTDGFYPRITFDTWLSIEDLPISYLPKESRLVVTLYGCSIQTDESQQQTNEGNNEEQQNKEGLDADIKLKQTELGWAALQLFNLDGMLSSGNYFLPLWPTSSDKRLGPAPHHMTSPITTHGIIHIEIPLYAHTGVCYSESVETIDTVVKDELRPFESLDAHTQSQLLHLIEQGAYQRMPTEGREILWEKREYLVELPGALPLVLLTASNWYGEHRRQLLRLIDRWEKPLPLNAMHLLLPCFPDEDVRSLACSMLMEVSDDSLIDVLSQLVCALNHDTWYCGAVTKFLLRRALAAPALAHRLYWLLQHPLPSTEVHKTLNTDKDSSIPPEVSEEGLSHDEASRWTPRLQLLIRALMTVVGQAMADNLRAQLTLVQDLSDVAGAVKSAREGGRSQALMMGADKVESFIKATPTALPLNLEKKVYALDTKSCIYFSSNTLPLKLNFIGRDNAVIPAMFKMGDDLRQDALVLQVIRVLDSLWIKEGLDLRMVSFQAIPTQHRKGMIEIVTEAETLRVIQTEFGLTGSFKDRPIAEWLAKHNPSELEYERARDNFTASCAGYSVATYLLGICDRHNDNIMLKTSGHLFHIDFGKFLGDAQMFGNFKRDRAPFVLTPDMAYVINGGERPSQRFHYFVELCCTAYNIARQHHQHILDLFALMSSSGAVASCAVSYVRSALLPAATQAEAAAAFARLIHSSLKSRFTPINFFLHNLAQLRASGDQNISSSELLSFMPRTYNMAQEGRLLSVEVLAFEKRYDPEKHYVYPLRIHRQGHATPSTLYRTYKHFTELYQKICMHFPLAKVHSLPVGLHVGRSNIRQVAERRKNDIQAFLTSLFSLADEIAHSDLVYTFFHPLLRDQQDAAPQRMKNKAEVIESESGSGSIKISVQYTAGVLSVLILHAQSLALTAQGLAPNPYVKVYLVPDPTKETKRKTRVLKRNSHPSFMEMLEYRLPLETVIDRSLKVTVWHYDSLQENTFLGGVEIPLSTFPLRRETVAWYPLQYLPR